jgi:hypothetical protein
MRTDMRSPLSIASPPLSSGQGPPRGGDRSAATVQDRRSSVPALSAHCAASVSDRAPSRLTPMVYLAGLLSWARTVITPPPTAIPIADIALHVRLRGEARAAVFTAVVIAVAVLALAAVFVVHLIATVWARGVGWLLIDFDQIGTDSVGHVTALAPVRSLRPAMHTAYTPARRRRRWRYPARRY